MFENEEMKGDVNKIKSSSAEVIVLMIGWCTSAFCRTQRFEVSSVLQNCNIAL